MTFGTCMEFCEDVIERDIRSLVKPDQKFIYVEVGIFQGVTLAGVGRILQEVKDRDWMAYGIDTPALDLGQVMLAWNNLPPTNLVIDIGGSPKFFETADERLKIDFLLIDGCHGYKCTSIDFLAAEPFIAAGGTVCFHDTAEPVQGSSYQGHCGEGIRVREALNDMGLLDNKRRGWRLKEIEERGYGCVLIEKI